jgi:hypothetical protein
MFDSVIDETITGVAYKRDLGKSFHQIKIGKIEKKYLFLTLIPDELSKNLNINMTINKYEKDTNIVLGKCGTVELDGCYIRGDSI